MIITTDFAEIAPTAVDAETARSDRTRAGGCTLRSRGGREKNTHEDRRAAEEVDRFKEAAHVP